MTQISTGLIPALNESLQLDLPVGVSFENLKELLSVHINGLIQSDFEKLVSLLYRIDISEAKLKAALNINKEKIASQIIAEMIIERQLQKIKSREEYRKNKTGDEDW